MEHAGSSNEVNTNESYLQYEPTISRLEGMLFTFRNLRTLAPRSVLLLAIGIIHAGLILWLAQRSMVPRAVNVVPITIEALAATPRSAQIIKLPPIAPTSVARLTLVPPEFDVPGEAPVTAAIATNQGRQPSSSAPAPAEPAASSNLASMSNVSYLQPPKPSYPREARLAHEEGLVILRVLIDEAGHARDIDVVQSSGHFRLDQEARNAVAHALFRPYTAGGISRPAIAMVPIEFSLHRS